MHSEYHLLDKADKMKLRIIELYSERSPCFNCSQYLGFIPESNITYSVDYSNQKEARKAIFVPHNI